LRPFGRPQNPSYAPPCIGAASAGLRVISGVSLTGAQPGSPSRVAGFLHPFP